MDKNERPKGTNEFEYEVVRAVTFLMFAPLRNGYELLLWTVAGTKDISGLVLGIRRKTLLSVLLITSQTQMLPDTRIEPG
ncbi:hypothetical protein DPMN_030587 [Dreissena polymorpha]|uniref:Uncharacterized protein n=1 Tax=Dreissena polymorpha TaxID=45954 RepID=A0A9D4M167_DREPO|nr:hypothetical protein DPMN_030587 [Dreissena polymorpha]